MQTPAEQRLTIHQQQRLRQLTESGYRIRRAAVLMGFRPIELWNFSEQLGYDTPWHWERAKNEFDRVNHAGQRGE